MDYQNRVGSKKGSGGVASEQQANLHLKKQLASALKDQYDLENNPYYHKNHVGLIECRLCYTTHVNVQSFIKHISGKKHDLNLQKRALLDKSSVVADETINVKKKTFIKIGKPAYTVTKIRDPETEKMGLLIKVELPETKVEPKHRFMSSFEVQDGTDHQYLVVASEPYESVCFKIPVCTVAKQESWFDVDTKEYFIQVLLDL